MNAPLHSLRPRAGCFSTPIFPPQANQYGTLFAGEALSLMARAAVLAAADRAEGDVVMAASSGISFRTPVRVGQVLHLTARIVEVGRTSLTICVEGEAGDLGDRQTVPVLEGLFKMVAVDEAGRPRPLPAHGRPTHEVV